MRVFVTGGAGYIGSVCVERLLESGHEVAVWDNLSEGHLSAVNVRASFYHGCLSERTSLLAALREFRAEVVLHFAAFALVGESMAQPGKYFRNNVAYGQCLLETAVEARVRKLIFSSTCAVYGIPDKVPIDEDTPTRPVNPYGESKLMFERMLHWYQQARGLEYVAFRYFNAAGASKRYGEDHRTETHLIPNVLKVALGRAPACEIYGTDYPTPDGTCIRDFIHVEDLADAHIAAMKPGIAGIYNLGNGQGYSVREVVAVCEKATGRKIKTRSRPRRPGDPPRLVASAEKARRDLGWQPRHPSLEEIVQSAWEWHREHPRGYPD
jgi:UDP-glucose 4-epimerase